MLTLVASPGPLRRSLAVRSCHGPVIGKGRLPRGFVTTSMPCYNRTWLGVAPKQTAEVSAIGALSARNAMLFSGDARPNVGHTETIYADGFKFEHRLAL
jgi:hypothetical protein